MRDLKGKAKRDLYFLFLYLPIECSRPNHEIHKNNSKQPSLLKKILNQRSQQQIILLQ